MATVFNAVAGPILRAGQKNPRRSERFPERRGPGPHSTRDATGCQ